MESPTLALLRESGEEPTRDNYLQLAFLGKPPKKLHPEDEAELPKPFQKGFTDLDTSLRDKSKKKKDKAAAESVKKKPQK